MIAPERNDPVLRHKLACVLASYERLTGEALCSLDDLFDAPFVLLAHGVEEPPILFYGNRRALALWKHDFSSFTAMPSNRTAEPDAREVRERLLAQVRDQGIIRDYTGVRVARDGSRFEIESASVWNVHEQSGERIGQAAMFRAATQL